MKDERKSVPKKLQDLAEKEGFLFAEIEGYKGYYVTTDGRVWGRQKNDFLKLIKKYNGKYLKVSLYKDGLKKSKQVHRLVAEAFLQNPQNKPQVNHKDENPENNTVDNLEWVASKENCNYGTRSERISKATKNRKDLSKPVVQMDKEDNILEIFISMKEATRKTGLYDINIGRVCRKLGYRHTAGGYKWRWATEAEIELLRKD